MAKKAKTRRPTTAVDPALSPVEDVTSRNLPLLTKLRLAACSAGRCQFRGHNVDLYQHPVTGTPGNFSEAAHIVAFRVRGPRGGARRTEEVNDFANLMLLCGTCHKLIDSEPDNYPVELLREYKREHEDRIFEVTAVGPEYRTTVIQLRGCIGGQAVDIPGTDIRAALRPRFPAHLPGVLVDLTAIQREDPRFFDLARDQIRRELRPAIRAELERQRVQHYSVFALAPIPVLMCLGREIGNKVTADLFQRQRDQSWRWREDGSVAEFAFRKVREGSDASLVALQLSISGQLSPESLPSELHAATVYEIVPANRPPGVECVRRREDLDSFRRTYRDGLRDIDRAHGRLANIHVFPAVPAPAAIACGMDVMPKAHPALAVYDYVKGTFRHSITVNTEEDL
jgi:hypothetical protein